MVQRRWMGVIISSRGGFAILVLVGSLLGGCTSLPDTSGYTVATVQVRYAVAAAGDAVKRELLSAINAEATTADHCSVQMFEAAWKATVGSLDAMVTYVQSIEQIVDAGNKGAESAKQVADSVKGLMPAVERASDVALSVYDEYAKHASAKSLEQELDRAGPSMAVITELVQAQIADARFLFVQQIEAQVQLLETSATGPEDAGRRFGSWIKLRGELEVLAADATKLLVRGIKEKVSNDIAKAKAMIADVEAVQKLVAPRLAEYEAKKHAIRQREKAGLSVLGAAENAVAAWGRAHRQLVKAVKERNPVSVESLTVAVVEIRTLIQRWNEL